MAKTRVDLSTSGIRQMMGFECYEMHEAKELDKLSGNPSNHTVQDSPLILANGYVNTLQYHTYFIYIFHNIHHYIMPLEFI